MEDKQLATKFQAYLLTEKRVSANTFAAYKQDVDQLLAYLNKESKELKSISPRCLKEYLGYLKNTLALSARSITRKISSLKVFFSYLNEHFGLDNAAEDLSFPKLEKKLPQYLSEDEVKHLLKIADKDTSDTGVRNKVMLYLLYVTGVRISELTNLKLSHIHFDTGFLHINGKGGKVRMVPVPQAVFSLVRAYIDSVHRAFTAKKNGMRKTDYLFPIIYASKVRPITRQAFWGILKQLCKKAGIERAISPHKLRHSLATHMLKSGVDLRSLQMLLGHENLATVQVYTHLETSFVRKVYDKKHPRS